MTRRTAAVLAAAFALAAAGCAQGDASSASAGRTPPAAAEAGPAVNCVQTSLIEDTRVWNDEVIDFRMRNGVTYRNTLPNRCPTLGYQARFAYRTSTGQLCRQDTITVLQSGSLPGPTCGLGPFQPVTIAR
jgi:hypothetical protein